MIVKDIPFQVIGQVIKFSTAAQLVANSAGIATATFSFSTDWSEYDTIKVIFSNGETKKSRIITSGQYTVLFPSECMTSGRIVVSAVGLKGAEGEETFKRATTERNNGVEVVPNGAFEGDPAGLPTPTEADEILLIATNANAAAAQANTTANTANATANTAITTANTADTKAQTALNHTNTYKGLRLAKQIILSEAAATIEFNTDSDGNPLNSVLGGELLFYSGANASISTANCFLQINGISDNEYWWSGTTPIQYITLGNVGNIYSEKTINIKNVNGNIIYAVDYGFRYSSGGSFGTYGGGMTTPQTAVTAIKLFLSSGTFPSGTVVEWWERG